MMRRIIGLFLIAVALVGCATCAIGPAFSPAPESFDGKSVLYVFRPKESFGMAPLIKIDGRLFVRLTAGGYSYAYLLPGIHRLVVGDFITEINVEPGKNIYQKCAVSGMTSIGEMNEITALSELQQYRYIVPVNADF